jgi:4-hydroxy-2-oxoheptanedioate aldolase
MNELRASLCSGPQLGMSYMYPAPGILERIGADWDWVWIDGQHGELGYNDTLTAVRACELIMRPAVVRVPGHAPADIGKALDTVPSAIMVPMVDTPEQARAVVQAAKFPPLGSRSYGGRRPIDRLGRGYPHGEGGEPLLICQIETPDGVDQAEAIAAVEGVDLLFFGPDDMRLRLGQRMDGTLPAGFFDEASRRVAQAARAQGKIAGSVFGTPNALTHGVEMGYRLIVCTADVKLLAEGSHNKSEALRDALSGLPSSSAGRTEACGPEECG